MWELPGGSCYKGQAGAATETRGCCYGIPARSRYGFPSRTTCSRYGIHSPRESYIILENKESSPSPYPRRVIHSRDDGAQVGDVLRDLPRVRPVSPKRIPGPKD